MEGDYLVGLARTEEVLPAPDAALIGVLMDEVPQIVTPDIDQEEAAWWATRHGRGCIAVAVGALLSILSFLAVPISWGERDAATVAGLSLFAASSVVLLLLWILDQFEVGPAFGSCPLAKLIQDMLPLLICVVIAVLVLG